MPLTLTQLQDIAARSRAPDANISALAREFHVDRATIVKIRAGLLGAKRLEEDAENRLHAAPTYAAGAVLVALGPERLPSADDVRPDWSAIYAERDRREALARTCEASYRVTGELRIGKKIIDSDVAMQAYWTQPPSPSDLY
jgi:hypothetical protein